MNNNSVFYKGIYGKKWYLSTWFICLWLFSWILIIPGIVALILLLKQHEENKVIYKKLDKARTIDYLLNNVKDLEKKKAQLLEDIANLEKQKNTLEINSQEECGTINSDSK